MDNSIPEYFQRAMQQFYDQLDILAFNPRLNTPLSVQALTIAINAQPTAQQRADLCLALWQFMDPQPGVEHLHPEGDKGLYYTTSVLRNILRSHADEILSQCGVETFDRLLKFWDVEGFKAAIDHEHWHGAAYILEHTMESGRGSFISDHRDRLLRSVLVPALRQMGCAPFGSLDEQKEMMVQQLQSRLTKIAINTALDGVHTQHSTFRKM